MKNNIENVLICGFGAIGCIYADKIRKFSNLKVLVDKNRLEKYRNNPTFFNGEKLEVEYVLPDRQDFKADLIIIATKYSGFEDALENIKNFVGENTVILSLLNGVTSEKALIEKYGVQKVLYSYFIGHSAVRVGRNITQDGLNTIVFGSPDNNSHVERVKAYFDKVGINYKIPDDIIRSMWLKFMLNVSANQTTGVLKFTFGEMLNNSKCMNFITNVMKEVQAVAKAENVKNTETMIDEALASLKLMSPDGKTSLLQDIEAGRKTEVDIFAGVIIELAKKHNIDVPYNKILKELIEIY